MKGEKGTPEEKEIPNFGQSLHIWRCVTCGLEVFGEKNPGPLHWIYNDHTCRFEARDESQKLGRNLKERQ